ncbi:efflux RND transporter permease subunit [Algoriphagus sp. D3-2-R+10]|uniref:efflux RND transporter permease subunit n=1 Tax=Algoriphagus aurantiacus TaxID=3103948 RepID=UPI002B3B2F5A|nr:efflux RND transporter permease subunit [Algoriphagus sp. D3-2-R+10]MEB2778341.1 efflux RND transporter permease subunit [Algoriphagus sp. D3-2-R+10]
MKSLISFFVKNASFTMVCLVAILALGVNSLVNMPRGEDPEVNFPRFFVIAVYPGASPLDMEDQVVEPLENLINELDDLKKFRSTIEDGLAVIDVEFDFGVDRDEKYSQLVREVNAARNELPNDIYLLEVEEFNSSDVNIFQIALISETASYAEMGKISEKFQDELKKVSGFKKVETWGYPEQEVRVELNLQKLAQQGIPLNYIYGALQSEDLNIPGGAINMNSRRFNVKTSGDYEDLEDIRNTVVFADNFKIIKLRDIATVDLSYEEEQHRTRFNGYKAVLVTASQKDGENIFDVGDDAWPIIEKFKSTLPDHVDMVVNFDQSENVKYRLKSFARDFGIAIFLVMLTLLPLGTRASLVVMISIPLSLSIGLFVMDSLGYTINQLSIVGLIVALGILVDDAIVVVENIERYLRNGATRIEASIEAVKQIAMAVVGVTATLVVAFLPLLYLPGGSGDFIRGLPIAVVTTVVASLLVSLTIVPFISNRILKTHTGTGEGNIFMRALQRFIDNYYSKVLDAALAKPWLTIILAGSLLLASFGLIPVIGFSLFPKSEKAQFQINVELPITANLDETDRVVQYIEGVLLERSDITYFTSNVGKGNPTVYYNVRQRNQQPNFAQLFVQPDAHSYEEKEIIINELRSKFNHYPNARIQVVDYEQGPPLEAPVAIRIFGENLDTLRSLSLRVEKIIEHTPGSTYISNPIANKKTDLKISINKKKAGLYGIPTATIDQTVRMAIAGLPIARYSKGEGEDKINIVATVPREKFATMEVLDNLYVYSHTGKAIPLRQVADITFESDFSIIYHYDEARYTSVNAHAVSGVNYATLNSNVLAELDKMEFPEGYYYKAAGELENKDDAFSGMEVVGLVSGVLFLLILILEFGSLKSSLIVLSVIPLGMIGALIALWLTGNPLSFTAAVGFIALIGIEIKNSILLVDFTNQLRSEGVELMEAIKTAAKTRFVPITLTTLTATLALVPLILDANPLYSGLVVVLMGGLISSTLLAFLVCTVVYMLIPPVIEVVGKKELLKN